DDVGGPAGMEWAARNRDRVQTLTVLDTPLKVDGFRRVWSMWLASPPVVGRLWVLSTRPPAARWLFYMQGMADRSATPPHEVDAHLELLHRGDGGRAFQRIVRSFEANAEKERLYMGALREAGWPARVLWGKDA